MPNVETLAIADLDFAVRTQVRQAGSVRPLRNLRVDLYELSSRLVVERVRVE